MNEMIAFEARNSEFVDSKSGVSARLTISAFENLISAGERRILINNEKSTQVRIADFYGVIPAITGKIELVYEGEQEGPFIVAQNLISKTIRKVFAEYFPNPDKLKKKKDNNPYKTIKDWFAAGNCIDVFAEMNNADFEKALKAVGGLEETVQQFQPKANKTEQLFFMELLLFGLAEYSQLSKNILEAKISFKDLFSSVFSGDIAFDEEEFNN
jgi:magnesium chelatase subunit I